MSRTVGALVVFTAVAAALCIWWWGQGLSVDRAAESPDPLPAGPADATSRYEHFSKPDAGVLESPVARSDPAPASEGTDERSGRQRVEERLKELGIEIPFTRPWQDRIEYAKLPVANPQETVPPDLKAWGQDSQFQAMMNFKAVTDRPTGNQAARPSGWDEPKRLVRGRVYELREDERVPLAGVLIHDWQWRHRTFSDEEGHFEFEAYWDEISSPEPVKGSNPAGGSAYVVTLYALAPGYIMMGPWLSSPERRALTLSHSAHYYQRELETPEGAELYMKRLENELVEVQLQNLHLARGEVTVCLASLPGLRSILPEERMAISTVADEQGRAWFSVPPDRFRFHGVSGDGVSTIYSNCKQTRVSDKHVRWEVPLEPCNNFLAQGVVTDVRDGHPLSHVVVRGSGFTELTFTDEQGRFALWLSREPRRQDGSRDSFDTQYFKFEADGYLWFTHPVDPMNQASERPAGSVTLGPGANEQGPWHVAMRPWTSANGRLAIDDYEWVATDKLDLALSNELFPPGYPRSAPINPDGTFTFEHIPWGVTAFRFNRMSADKPGSWRLKVDPASWQGSEPHKLVVTRE